MNYNIYMGLTSNSRQSFLSDRIVNYNHNLDFVSNNVMNAISKTLGITKDQLKSHNRFRHITEARHIYCYIMRNNYYQTLFKIGKTINKDHTTVLHSNKMAKDLIETSKIFKSKYELVDKELNSH